MMSLSLKNLDKFVCQVMKYYNDWVTVITVYCDREHFPCKNYEET
jgi:hypothetical protein